MPSSLFAQAILYLWPVLAVLAFRLLPRPAAVASAVIVGYLLLPQRISYPIPLLPDYDRNFAIILGAFLVAAASGGGGTALARKRLAAEQEMPGWVPRQVWALVFLAGLVGGIFATAMTNSTPLFWPSGVSVYGLTSYDALAAALETFFLLLPFFLGRKYFGTPQGQRTLVYVLAVAAALYMLPTLFEVRMSPLLHNRIYGFYQHDFRQLIRSGGFRPMVFLQHPLWLAIFLCMGFFASLACARWGKPERRWLFLGISGLLLVTMVLSKCLAALVMAVTFGPVLMFTRPSTQLVVAAAVATAVMIYPALRKLDLVPLDRILAYAAVYSEERSGSLAFRIEQETAILDHAASKPLLGWGPWKRWRVVDEKGRDRTVADSTWVITFAQGGWVRYLSTFGLLGMPVLLLAWRRRRLGVDGATSALALVMMVSMLDMTLNATLTVFTWLVAGALAGRLEFGVATDAAEAPAAAVETGPRNPYAPVLARDQISISWGGEPGTSLYSPSTLDRYSKS